MSEHRINESTPINFGALPARWLPWTLALLLAFAAAGATVAAESGARPQPIDILRDNVAAGIAVLTSPTLESKEERQAQQRELCRIANNMFDTYAFSRLVLAGEWQRFATDEQVEFVEVFGEFLCRYYLSRLQARYNNETVEFGDQVFKSPTRASVSATVRWRNFDVPIEVRMVLREGQWRAYDLVAAGISAVMIYRTQFRDELRERSPREVINDLRARAEAEG